MSVSKSVRFEVFARDAFTCQYCGRRPPDVVLELDHIHPRSKGGTDEIVNLLTSCYACNRGKSAKVISDVAPRPDADLVFLKVQQEIAEVKRFLAAKKKLDVLHRQAIEALQNTWSEYLTREDIPSSRVFTPWINTYGADEVERSIKIATIAYTNGRFGRNDGYAFDKLLPYVGAILRNRRADRETGAAIQ
jgi:HNH endonuclease